MADTGAVTARPPSRYRVVEQGRRLVVVDRWQEEGRPESVTPPPVTQPRTSLPQLPRQTRFDGSADLTTHPLYDDKAPRPIRLDAGSAAIIDRVKLGAVLAIMIFVVLAIAEPWLIAVPVLLAQNGVRKPVRAAITRWLDRVEREGS